MRTPTIYLLKKIKNFWKSLASNVLKGVNILTYVCAEPSDVERVGENDDWFAYPLSSLSGYMKPRTHHPIDYPLIPLAMNQGPIS